MILEGHDILFSLMHLDSLTQRGALQDRLEGATVLDIGAVLPGLVIAAVALSVLRRGF